MWVKAPDGTILPALSADPDDDDQIGHHPHACSVRAAGCEPREGLGESPAQRMVRDLARSSGTAGTKQRSSRKQTIGGDMAQALDLYDRKRREKRQKT